MRVEQLLKRVGNKKIGIWGTGAYGMIGYGILKSVNAKVDFFGDNNTELWGKEIVDGIICKSTQELEKEKEDIVFFIMIKDRNVCEDVYQQLWDLGFEYLVCRYELFDSSNRTADILKQLIHKEITTFYGKNPLKNQWNESENRRKKVVYTCVSGGYDDIEDIKIKNPAYDYYYISDKQSEKNNEMKYIDIDTVVPPEITNPILKARYCKTHPHVIFPQYTESIYYDGKLDITGDITKLAKGVEDSEIPLGIFKHPDRDCVYQEGIACVLLRKAEKSEVVKQLNEYIEKGMPSHYGMFDTCFLVRKHRNSKIVKIMEDWWNEMLEKTPRDQLSFTYTLWENGCTVDDVHIIPCELTKNTFFKIKQHKK